MQFIIGQNGQLLNHRSWVVAVVLCVAMAPGVLRAQAQPDVVWRITGHGDSVEAVAFSADGTMVASGANASASEVHVRSAADGTLLHTFPGGISGVRSLAFSPSGETLAVGSIILGWPYPIPAGVADIWDLSSETMLHRFSGGNVSFSADGTRVASAGQGVNRNIAVHSLPGGADVNDIATGDQVIAMVLAPNGDIAASSEYYGEIRLWNVNSGVLLDTLTHGDRPYALAISPDGALLASGNLAFEGASSIKVWEVSTGQLIYTLTGDDRFIVSLAFSPNGNLLAAATTSTNLGRRIRFLRVSDGAELASVNPGSAAVNSLEFSPDGRLYVYGSSNGSVTVARVPLPIEDVNVDGVVDMLDHATMAACLGGPGVLSPPTGCSASAFAAADLDRDGDVDLRDHSALQASFANE